MDRTLALPLSGEEVIEAIVSKVRDRLRLDCYLNSTCAYEAFSAEIAVKLKLNDSGRESLVDQLIKSSAGNLLETSTDETDDSFLIDEAAPNEVRVDTNQPVPMLTTDAQGKPEIKRVSYRRPQRARPIAPKTVEAQAPDSPVETLTE